ncbi:MAG: hypothetical protein WBD20_02000 [Pirellulaceae bacterium]
MLRKASLQATESSVARSEQAAFRIMVQQATGDTALYRVESTLRQATRVAESACRRLQQKLDGERARVLLDLKRPRLVYIQQWVGSATIGHWDTIPLGKGGYVQRFHDAVATCENLALKSGQIVPCELLSRRTRRGGWRAQISQSEIVGPITNWPDVPTTWKAGDIVPLQLCCLSCRSRAAQFRWTES